MDYQNYLYLEYRRTIRKFQKLQSRFEKRIAKDTFQELTARRRYKILTQLRKLKQKIEQLTSRLKLATVGGSMAFTMAVGLGMEEANAQTVEGTPKSMTVGKTLVNDNTTGSQRNAAVDFNNENNAVIIWQEEGDDIYGKAYGDDISNSVTFNVQSGTTAVITDPVVSMNDNNDFIVAWSQDDGARIPTLYEIKYMRYSVEDGVVTDDGPFTVATSSNSLDEVDIALDNSGNFAIVWEEAGTSYEEIKAKYYSSENISDGELEVSQSTNFDQTDPAVDIDEDGNFIIVWKGQEGEYSSVSVLNTRSYNQNSPLDNAEALISFSDFDFPRLHSPDVALNGDGSFVVAWEYESSYGTQEYIRSQVYDADKNSISNVINVASSSYTLMGDPQIAMDKDGGFVVSYNADSYGGNQQTIAGKRYNRFGDQIESWNFYNESTTSNVAGGPAIGMNDRGDFVVAWEDNLSATDSNECTSETDCDSYGIYFKKYEGSENQPYLLDEIETINTYTTGSQAKPVIAKDVDGNYVVVWQGAWNTAYEEGTGIIGQRFNADGSRNGDEFHINTTTTGNQTDPDVAMNDAGEFIVTWKGYAGTSVFGVFAQMYDATGTPVGSEIRVDDETTTFFNHNEPAVAIADDGDAIVIYVEDYYDHVKVRRINADGTTNGDEFKVDAYSWSGNRHYPDVALNNDGSFIAAFGLSDWSEEHTYYRRFDAANNPLDAEDVQITSGTFNFTRKQVIALDKTSGDFIIVYNEYSSGSYNIYASKYTAAGTPEFEEVLIAENMSEAEPFAEVNSNGEIAIAYGDPIELGDLTAVSILDPTGDIFIEYYPFGYNSIGDNPALIINDNTETMVVHDNSLEIFGAKFAKPLDVNLDAGEEFIVNSLSSNDQEHPDIAQNENGDFVIVWRDYSNSSYPSVKAQRYNKEGIRQGTEIKINSSTASTVYDPEVALNNEGNFMVVWREWSVVGGESNDILGSVLDWEGNTIKDDFIINEITANDQYHPDIALNDEGGFQVIWNDRFNYTQNAIIGQKFDAEGVADAAGNVELGGLANTYERMDLNIAINNDGDLGITYYFEYTGDYYSGLNVYNRSFEPIVEDLNIGENDEFNLAAITADENGDFVVAWEGYDIRAYSYLFVRKFSGGSTFESEAVPIKVTDNRLRPSIAAVDDGDFVISYIQDIGSYSVYSQRLSNALELIGPEIKVSEISVGDTFENEIASSADGSYTIAWQNGFADNSGYAIMAKQFVSHKPTVEVFGLTLDEGAESTFSSEHIIIENPAGNSDNAFVKFTSVPANGTLSLEGADVMVGDELGIDYIALLTYSHDGSETSSDAISFTVANENFETNEMTFDISITPVNDIPILTANNGLELDEGDTQSLYETLAVTDPDHTHAELTYTLTAIPEHGELRFSESTVALEVGHTFTHEDVSFANIHYEHNDTENHADSFQFTLSDGEHTTEAQQFDITIIPVNDVPVVSNPIEDQSGTTGQEFSLAVNEVFSDPDHDLTLSASLADDSALPEWLSFDAETETFSGTPDEVSSFTIKVSATDGTASATDEFELTIGNQAPAVANAIADQVTDQYEAFSFTIPANTFADTPADDLTLAATQADDSALPAWLSFAPATHILSGTPSHSDYGEIDIKITATDGSSASVASTFKLTVNFVLNANEKLTDVNFYPNPAESTLTLSLDERMHGEIDLLIYNQSGRMVSLLHLNKTQSSQSFEIDVESLRKGIYLVKLVNKNTSSTFKINKK